MPINSINLAISNRCSADCTFCPMDRGARHRADMPMDVVERVIGEAACMTFPWGVRRIETGENGDALLNLKYLDILRYIRARMPSVHINLTNNLANMTIEKSKAILSERLIDSLQFNIDGHNAETYEAQKRLPYADIIDNLRDLIDTRAKTWPLPITVHVLPLSEYRAAVKRTYCHEPCKIVDRSLAESNLELVRQSLHWLPQDIGFDAPRPFGWAERDGGYRSNGGNWQCPMLPRIENEAFIDPTGAWYPCCYDGNANQAYGSVMHQTLAALHESAARKLFIGQLKARQFQAIGYPCDRVEFCHVLH